MMDVLLSRLRKVKKTGTHQWIACCPAHDDRSPSLSIREVGDGRILLNCLAGCETELVLSNIGMTFADISPEKPLYHKAKPVQPRVYSTDALKLIKFETQIVLLSAYELRRNKPLDEADLKRLELAMERIKTAAEMANV